MKPEAARAAVNDAAELTDVIKRHPAHGELAAEKQVASSASGARQERDSDRDEGGEA